MSKDQAASRLVSTMVDRLGPIALAVDEDVFAGLDDASRVQMKSAQEMLIEAGRLMEGVGKRLRVKEYQNASTWPDPLL